MRSILPAAVLILLACDHRPTISEMSRDEIPRVYVEWIDQIDHDGDDQVSPAEFDIMSRNVFADLPETTRQSWATRDFAMFDTNHDGYLTAADFTAIALSEFDCRDADRDGRLTAAEQLAERSRRCPVLTVPTSAETE